MQQRIGIFMPTWVGDVVMATPTLRALRRAYPAANLVGVMRPVIHDLLAGSDLIDHSILFDKKRRPGLPTRFGLIGALRQAKLDSILLLTNSLWTAAVARFAGIRRIVGYNRDARGWLLTDRVPVTSVHTNGKTPSVPAVDYYLQLAEYIGCDIDDRRSSLSVTAEESRLADSLWDRCQFASEVPTVVINSNSATDLSRLWPADHVRQLASRLATERNCQVLFHCGPAERAMADALAAEVNHPRVASMGVEKDLPIGLSKAVLARAAVVVSTDSGPRHIAVALNRPVVSLFGPTSPVGTRTYNLPETLVEANLECRPCYAKSCPLKHGKCMSDISVQTVLEAVERSLNLPWLRVA